MWIQPELEKFRWRPRCLDIEIHWSAKIKIRVLSVDTYLWREIKYTYFNLLLFNWRISLFLHIIKNKKYGSTESLLPFKTNWEGSKGVDNVVYNIFGNEMITQTTNCTKLTLIKWDSSKIRPPKFCISFLLYLLILYYSNVNISMVLF